MKKTVLFMALAIVLTAAVMAIGGANFSYNQPDTREFNPLATVNKTANYTATAADSYIKVSTASGAVTITLPTTASLRAAGLGAKAYKIEKTTADGYAVTVSPGSGDTISGTTSRSIRGANSYLIIQSQGKDWAVSYETPPMVTDMTTGQTTANGYLHFMETPFTALTGSTSLTRAQSGRVLLNTGASGNLHVLPLAASCPGCRFIFVTGSTATFAVDPNIADTIIPTTNAAGDKILSPVSAGASITIYSVGTTSWIVTAMTPTTGSWMDDN